MRAPAILFGWVLVTAALLGGLVVRGPESGALLGPHPDLPSLLVGGDGAARLAPVFGWGAALAFAQVGLLASAFALGFGRTRLGARRILPAALVHGLSLVALLWSAARYVEPPEPGLLGPFPAPTTILVFVVWPAPLVYLWLFLRHFEAWLPSESTEARLRALRRGEPGAPTP